VTARILIVDDVAGNARLLAAKLASEYYQTQLAHSGEAAIEAARAWQPDLVLLDVMMPGMDGYQCCTVLKQDPLTAHVPVVMITSLDEREQRIEGLEAGADDFLTKPVDLDALLVRARNLIKLKRTMDEWRVRGEAAGSFDPDPAGPAETAGQALVLGDWTGGERAEQGRAVVRALTAEGIVPWFAPASFRIVAARTLEGCDLIVLDLSRSGDDPLQVIAVLRASDSGDRIPVILAARPADRARTLRALELGANDWIACPIDESELRARVRNQVKRKRFNDRLQADVREALKLSFIDALTGLYNRRYANRAIERLAAQPAFQPFAVLLVDVDHFKLVNDRYGHKSGDAALQQIATCLQSATRAYDTVARYGGEEFLIVMPRAGRTEAALAAERVRSAVERLRFETDTGLCAQLTVSAGVACAEAPCRPVDVLMREADEALYLAKRQGRNRVELAAA
jgi:two-component system cell cycle response regulator